MIYTKDTLHDLMLPCFWGEMRKVHREEDTSLFTFWEKYMAYYPEFQKIIDQAYERDKVGQAWKPWISDQFKALAKKKLPISDQ